MDEDEETLCRYGTPLPSYEEDVIPSKKPVPVEDQIVLDVNGKRRFHGAFTGGFSAGYWNTVGSEEGWKPTEFKSSRKEKASFKSQNPEDFMDDEDLGEFGIAPQRVQTKPDFAHSSTGPKRRMVQGNWGGPIPGQPVLKALLEPAKEKTAILILKKMGWREGQGIGDRQSKAEKKKAKERNRKEEYVMKMYGCNLPGERATTENSESDSDVSDYEVTFAPDDFDPLVAAIKDNTFGMGYSGLERQLGSSSSMHNVLEILDRNNKKLSIRGQAFGVGALEDDDDEDIYAKDDMSRYDFSLEGKSKQTITSKSVTNTGCIEGFCTSKKIGRQIKKVFRISLPEQFSPRNWGQRLSRFEPLNETLAKRILSESQHKKQGLGRHDLDPKTRGQVFGESPSSTLQSSKNEIVDLINKRASNFVTGEIINKSMPSEHEEAESLKKDLPKLNLRTDDTNLNSIKESFKPFITDTEKQERYDKFLCYKISDKYQTKEIFLSSLQPLGMSPWDRERELKEFIQAQRMYRPMDGLMSDRFVTESSLVTEKEIADVEKTIDIVMKRSKVMWKPHKELCKRFNVPEPFGGKMDEEKAKPKSKLSVFDYLEAPVNNKSDFVTPVIIPKSKTESSDNRDYIPVRVSAKIFFSEKDRPSTSNATYPTQLPLVTEPSKQGLKKSDNRTELEQKVLDSLSKKPEEKKDLFKSIFCSSDEEEENEIENQQTVPVLMTESEKLKLVESLVAIKPASQVNVLRNDSPPRGIFKSILDIKGTIQQPNEALSPNTESINLSSDSDEYYGPKLPSQVPVLETAEYKSETFVKNIEETSTREHTEEWVEKGKPPINKNKKKKHKEHKKSKKLKKDKKSKKVIKHR
ncbi:G patch domain-containing protein 1 homolog [Topomyia yanbarensis]|uniref:G patch domain-containing protein 1 homolog n=1 Tax=Topomyia yanbarensis TaxID=2498891 RepID=UPI00273AD8F3|nr:G patch domain-containing protein 1 homolog [Topomyia yanbarensis]